MPEERRPSNEGAGLDDEPSDETRARDERRALIGLVILVAAILLAGVGTTLIYIVTTGGH